MTTKPPAVESPEMAILRTAHVSHQQTRSELISLHARLKEVHHLYGIDIKRIVTAIRILQEVDTSVVFAYGRLCLERDLPSLRRPG